MLHLIRHVFHRTVDFLTIFGTQYDQDFEADSASSRQVMADCLGNAVVLRKLFQHFSNPELLELSFVNKLWNYEARSMMQNRRNLVAHLQFLDDQPCQEYVDAFAADLSRMNVVPFTGIHITLYHSHNACQAEALDSTYNAILCKLSFKSVSVDLMGDWTKNKDCPGSVLVQEILANFSEVLQEVSLENIGSEEDELIIGLVNYCSFPSLKILKLGESYESADRMYITSIFRALVAGAPKLQELHTQGPIDLMLTVLEGTSIVLVLQSVLWAPFDEIPDHAVNGIRLERIQLNYTGPNFNVERFNRITPRLLKSSCSATLGAIDMDAVLAVSLMCFGIRLDNVTELTMDLDPTQMSILEPRILMILKDFDFTRILPNLDKVMIFAPFDDLELSPDHMNGFVVQAETKLKEPEPDRAINIKELDLSTSFSSCAEFFARMFPHIERLRLTETDGKVSLGSTWENWVHLKELNVMADVEQNYEDLDSVICGIFPEEVAELRQKDDEFLKNVNIVPVMPAITCLRSLRMFFLSFEPRWDGDEMLEYPNRGYVGPLPSLNLSKVTGLVAFGRCPNLHVTLSCYGSHLYQALKYMKPYASVLNMLPYSDG